MKKIIAALTFTMLSQTVMAAEWYLVETTKNAFFFVDKSSMVRSGSTVKFWAKTVRNSPKGNPPYDNTKILQSANCKTRTIKYDYYQFYYGEKQADAGTPPKETTQPVIPDTPLETIYQTVCSGKFNGKPVADLSIQEIQAVMADFYAHQTNQ